MLILVKDALDDRSLFRHDLIAVIGIVLPVAVDRDQKPMPLLQPFPLAPFDILRM